MNWKDIWQKISAFFTLDTLEEEREEKQEDKGDKIVRIYQKQDFKIHIYQPKDFEEVKTMVEQLQQNKPVILNLADLDSEQAKMIIDFMSGAVYALKGNLQKLGEKVFIFTPENVIIDSISGSEEIDKRFYQ